MRRSLALLLATAGVASCAPTDGAMPGGRFATDPGGARPCFQAARIQNFTSGGTDQIYIRVMGGGVFSLQSAGCPDIGTGSALSITSATGISDQLCVGDRARVTLPSGSFGSGQCIARISEALTPAQIEALPSRQRP